MTPRGRALFDLAVWAALRDDLPRSFLLLRLLVRLIHGAFEFAQPLAQAFGNIGNFHPPPNYVVEDTTA